MNLKALLTTIVRTKSVSILNHNQLLRVISLLFVMFWIYGFLFPVFDYSRNKFLEFLLSEIYSPICHMQADKCIAINGNRMLVCARCAGIYSGALFAAVLAVLNANIDTIKILLPAALLLMIADVVFTNTGFYVYSQPIAFASGFPFGFCIFIYLIRELEIFSFNRKVHE